MKPPQGHRARHLAAFQAERARVKACVEAVWQRAESKCAVCRKTVTRLGETPHATGFVWFMEDSPAVKSGRLLCGVHFHGRENIRTPRFVLER